MDSSTADATTRAVTSRVRWRSFPEGYGPSQCRQRWRALKQLVEQLGRCVEAAHVFDRGRVVSRSAADVDASMVEIQHVVAIATERLHLAVIERELRRVPEWVDDAEDPNVLPQQEGQVFK